MLPVMVTCAWERLRQSDPLQVQPTRHRQWLFIGVEKGLLQPTAASASSNSKAKGGSKQPRALLRAADMVSNLAQQLWHRHDCWIVADCLLAKTRAKGSMPWLQSSELAVDTWTLGRDRKFRHSPAPNNTEIIYCRTACASKQPLPFYRYGVRMCCNDAVGCHHRQPYATVSLSISHSTKAN